MAKSEWVATVDPRGDIHPFSTCGNDLIMRLAVCMLLAYLNGEN